MKRNFLKLIVLSLIFFLSVIFIVNVESNLNIKVKDKKYV